MNKLQPYFSIGEKLGSFASQLTTAAVKSIRIEYAGELSEVDVQPLTRYIIKGVLSRHLGSEVNIVNSLHLAKIRDLNIQVNSSSTTKGFTNLITVTLVEQDDQQRSVSGTLLYGYGERIVQVNEFPIDSAPDSHLLLISHNDQPGIIGSMGTLLGGNDVNIATMQVGRKVVGGEAVMLLSVDKEVPKNVLTELVGLPAINSAQEITL